RNAPNVTIRNTDLEIPFISLMSRLELPSNNTIATAKEIKGLYKSPIASCGLKKPETGPSNNPAIDIITMDGHWIRQASHCEKIPTTRIITIPIKMVFVILSPKLSYVEGPINN